MELVPDLSKLNKIKNVVSVSPFVDNLKKIRWTFSIKQNINFLFDNARNNEKYPYIYVNCGDGDKEYTKILNGTIVPNEWIEYIQLFNEKNEDIDNKKEKYKNFIITEYIDIKSKISQKIIITETFILYEQKIKTQETPKNIITNLFPEFDINQYLSDEEIIKNKGYIYMYNIPNFNKELLLDYIMTDKIGRQFLIIKENITLVKSKKKNIKLNLRYPTKNGIINIGLSILILYLEKGQQIFKTRYWNSIGLGNIYLLINININNNINASLLNEIIENISKLFSKYSTTEAEELQNIYLKYLPSYKSELQFAKKKEKITKKNIKLKDKIPEMFVNQYTRLCQRKQNNHLKEIQVYETLEELQDKLNDTENKLLKNQDIQYMTFPANEEYLEYIKEQTGYEDDLNQIPIDFKPYYFLCDNEVHTNPGLIINKSLSNKNLFPYLPCCYASSRPQFTIEKGKGTGLWNYLHNINPNEESNIYTNSDIVIKGKIQLKPNIKGPVPLQIEDIMKIIKPDHSFFRLGMEGSRYTSFISCLNKALNIKINMKELLEDEDIILNLPLLKQCNFTKNISEIIEMLLNEDSYLDPRLCSQFFEYCFGINIILFSDILNSNNEYVTTIIQPHNKAGHLIWENKFKKTILIYLSTGSTHLQDERCELIMSESDQNTFYFYNRYVYEYLRLITSQIYNQFSLFTPYYIFNHPSFFDGIKYQSIDSYGKVFRIKINDYTIDTQPLPPIPNVPIKQLKVAIISSSDVLLQLLKDSTYRINDNKIIINKENLNFCVYWKSDAKIVDIQNFVNEIHIANIMKDIFVFQYSKLNKKKFPFKIDIEEFSDSFDIVSEDNYQDYISSFLLSHPSTFLNNYSSSFLYPNNKCKNRLIYYLSLLCKFNPKYVLNYCDNIYLDHYYSTIFDFKQNQESFISSSLDALRYINHQYICSDKILSNRNEPYFMISNLFNENNNKVFLCINMYSFEDALKLNVFWHSFRYIPPRDEDFKLIYPEDFQSEEIKNYHYSIIDFDSLNITNSNSNSKINKYLIATKIINETKYFCPLLY